MELNELRLRIDAVDAQLTELLTQRMDIAQEIGLWKREHGLPVLDARREQEKLDAIRKTARDDMAQDLRTIYSLLFELSRARQDAIVNSDPGGV